METSRTFSTVLEKFKKKRKKFVANLIQHSNKTIYIYMYIIQKKKRKTKSKGKIRKKTGEIF
jgi:hypothetical protein